MIERIKEKFKFGIFKENVSLNGIDFIFYSFLEITTVHTTFFLKDYEIKSFLHVFGEKVPVVSGDFLRKRFSTYISISKNLLKLPPDHYLSTFIFLIMAESFSQDELPYFRKKILFGLKGSFQVAPVVICGSDYFYPTQIEYYINWLLS